MSVFMPPVLAPVGPQRRIFTVRAVEDRWGLREFARVPWQVYTGDRYWSPPLARERLRALYPDYNPRLNGQEPGLFVAEARNLGWTDETVGSIAAWFDPAQFDAGTAAPRTAFMSETEASGVTACFGMFEVTNEPEMAEELLDAAEQWLFEHAPGLSAIVGPLNLEPLQPPGLLVDGFNVRHGAYLPYHPPYYVEMMEAAGYEPAQESYAYTLALDMPPRPVPDTVTLLRGAGLRSAAPSIAALYRGGETAVIEPIPGLAELLDGIVSARFGLEGRLNNGWLRNAMTAATIREDGAIVAAAVALPDAGHALRPWRGRLLPFGWLPYRFALRRPASLRVFPAAIRPEHQGHGWEAALYATLAASAAQQGCRRVVFGPVAAEAAAAQAALNALGARRTATYHLYRKSY